VFLPFISSSGWSETLRANVRIVSGFGEPDKVLGVRSLAAVRSAQVRATGRLEAAAPAETLTWLNRA